MTKNKKGTKCLGRITGNMVPALCFEDFIAKCEAETIKRGARWDDFPCLLSENEGFYKRFNEVEFSEKKERINFPSKLKKFMRETHPDWEYVKSLTPYAFRKKLSKQIDLEIVFRRRPFYGLGKAFTMDFTIVYTDGDFVGTRWTDNVFRLYGESSNTPPCWTYATSSDLQEVFQSIDLFLTETCQILESYALTCLSNLSGALPETIKVRTPFTAKQGLCEAETLALALYPEVKLSGVFSQTLLSLRNDLGAGLSPDGKVNIHGAWLYRFFAPGKNDELIYVKVPYAGDASFFYQLLEKNLANNYGYFFVEFEQCWLDSDNAMDIAEKNGGQAARSGDVDNFDILMRLEKPYSHRLTKPQWDINYLITNSTDFTPTTRRIDCHLTMDGYSGGDIKVLEEGMR